MFVQFADGRVFEQDATAAVRLEPVFVRINDDRVDFFHDLE